MLQKKPSNDLKVGMFVADLDRPWMDTPFLLQGFMLEDAEQITQIQAHCKWVMIDPMRSAGQEFEQRPAKNVTPQKRDLGNDPVVTVHRTAAATPTSVEQLRAATGNLGALPSTKKPTGNTTGSNQASPKKVGEFAVPISQRTVDENQNDSRAGTTASSRDKLPSRGSGGLFGLFGQLKQDVKNLFSSSQKDDLDLDQYTAPAKVETARPSFLPETVQLTIYEDKKPVESEIGAAKDAFTNTHTLLQNVVADIRSGNTMQVDVVERVIEDMVDSMVRNPDAMMWVARMREKNSSTYDHGLRVAINLIAFGRHLGYPKEHLAQLGIIGLLLDIGKIRIPLTLLEKHARLTPAEFAEIKLHVKHSVDILNQTAHVNPDVIDAVAQHHERMDGSGYPFGLSGNAIGIFGKMAAIADTYSAITTKRAYAEAASPHEALQMLTSWGGAQFQAEMIEHFIQSIGVFPVGSLVELSTGEVAVVVTHNKQKRLRPKVLVVTEVDKKLLKHPNVMDLIYDVSDNPIYIRRGLPSDAYGIDPNEYYLG